ncbi:MAG: DUF465 domain-containing protein [Caulobacterales bacterium]
MNGDGEILNLDPEEAALRSRLFELRAEHRALDAAVDALHLNGPTNLVEMARLKKRKLSLKDEITWLEGRLRPDIIA